MSVAFSFLVLTFVLSWSIYATMAQKNCVNEIADGNNSVAILCQERPKKYSLFSTRISKKKEVALFGTRFGVLQQIKLEE